MLVVREITEMEGIEHRKQPIAGGLVYTISGRISRRRIEDHLKTSTQRLAGSTR